MTSKDKKRNTDKRKEKSRDAARCRRSKESEVFYELAQNLPIASSVTAQLDKASIMRLAISFLKICQIREEKQWIEDEESEDVDIEIQKRLQQMYPKALEGFVLILSKEGDIIYLSENTSKYLGIQQIELMGQSIFDFTHPCDHEEIRDLMVVRNNREKSIFTEERMIFMRMKCTLTSKGKSVNLKSATYKVVKCTGRLVVKKPGKEEDNSSMYPYLMAVAEPIPHPANIEVLLDSSAFLSKHNMDMKFTYCDDRIKELIGYDCDSLTGKSLYDYHHALDSEIVEKAYKDLFAKGQTMTGQYRFLAKDGGYVWMITQATVIYNNRTQKPQWVVCVHFVISAVLDNEMVLSQVQRSAPEELMTFKMELNTDKIFAPKTKDMDTHYFVPPDLKNSVTLVNDEPEDLSYLAPTAGDGCVSLAFPSFSQVAEFGNIKTDVVLPPVLKEEPGSSLRDMCRNPDLISSNNPSPAPISPMIQSPDDYQTMGSPSAVDLMDKFFSTIDTKQGAGCDSDIEELDLNMRAPYIPMDGEEDSSLIPPSTDALFSLQNDFNPGLFGTTETVFMDKNIFGIPPRPRQPSVRDMVGGSTVVASIEQPVSTMMLQFKRPLDMNSLEKGPPVAKVLKLSEERPSSKGAMASGQENYPWLFLPPASFAPSHLLPPISGASGRFNINPLCIPEGQPTSKDSVLLNLLLTGEDRNHGYKVNSALQRIIGGSKKSLFTQLTRQDCEVNAPTPSQHLLQGEELLKALDADYRQSRRNMLLARN